MLEDETNEIYGKEFQQALILRLAGTVLPRLNEHTGENGEAININVSKEISDKNENRNYNLGKLCKNWLTRIWLPQFPAQPPNCLFQDCENPTRLLPNYTR